MCFNIKYNIFFFLSNETLFSSCSVMFSIEVNIKSFQFWPETVQQTTSPCYLDVTTESYTSFVLDRISFTIIKVHKISKLKLLLLHKLVQHIKLQKHNDSFGIVSCRNLYVYAEMEIECFIKQEFCL